VSPRYEEPIEEDELSDHSDAFDHSDDEGEFMLRNRSQQWSTIRIAPAVQPRHCSLVSAAPSSAPRNDAPCCPHSVGKDVILYAMLRPEQPMAKGTIISTNLDNKHSGVALGKQYCEVVVNVVLKRDTVLPRPYDSVETMADAYKMPIAWSYQKVIIFLSIFHV